MTPPSNPKFEKEPPEASREVVDDAVVADKGAQQGSSNRPVAEEERQQEKLPPRGEAKTDDEGDGRKQEGVI